MTPTTRTWLLCALSLCGSAHWAQPHRGRCAGKKCVVFVQERTDFAGAQEGCQRRFWTLLETTELPDFVESGGTFWVGGPAAGGSDPRRCASVSAASGGKFTVLTPRPCAERLGGFLCGHGLEHSCGAVVAAAAGAHVNYTFGDFEIHDSASFPQGTAAQHPDSKHLCHEGGWKRAPWNCEVMGGGCEGPCVKGRCTCPEGQSLHVNGFACVKEPCADCEAGGGGGGAGCDEGYRLADDGKTCVDVDECAEKSRCLEEGEECVNLKGRFECRCREGFDREDGKCMDVSVCHKCEQDCLKVGGEFRCVCKRGFKASEKDPNKCLIHCGQQECLAHCVPDAEREKNGNQQCFCPDGFIKDPRGNVTYCTDIDECYNEKPCDHVCKNLPGSFTCLCREGFRPSHLNRCQAVNEPKRDGGGKGVPAPTPAATPAGPSGMGAGVGASVPPYVRTGSILGITVFLLLCLVLVLLVVRDVNKRCATVSLHTLKPDMDIFSLQQVTTETYKRLSLDRQSRVPEGQT